MVLLNAKTTVPHAFAETVERERLYDLLGYNALKRIISIQAPAGYGKTILLSQWFNLLKDPVALTVKPLNSPYFLTFSSFPPIDGNLDFLLLVIFQQCYDNPLHFDSDLIYRPLVLLALLF